MSKWQIGKLEFSPLLDFPRISVDSFEFSLGFPYISLEKQWFAAICSGLQGFFAIVCHCFAFFCGGARCVHIVCTSCSARIPICVPVCMWTGDPGSFRRWGSLKKETPPIKMPWLRRFFFECFFQCFLSVLMFLSVFLVVLRGEKNLVLAEPNKFPLEKQRDFQRFC